MDFKNENFYVNNMRSMAVQAIQKAGQGHIGMAMSAAPITFTLFTRHINLSKDEPKWINRDRFVMSAGHGSMCLYPILCFSNLLSLEQIKLHKKADSQTPGHPEFEHNNHVDASTGPLGQGIAMATGMAIAQKYLSNKFSTIRELIDHKTYVLLGDGDLEEGIGYEAMSLAARMNLSNLIFIHDSNKMQLESSVQTVFKESIEARVKAQGLNYISTSNSIDEIDRAIIKAKSCNIPTFIEVHTILGEGISVANTPAAHGATINNDEITHFEKYYNISARNFIFDKSVYDFFYEKVTKRGQNKYTQWLNQIDKLKNTHENDINTFLSWSKGEFNSSYDDIFNPLIIKNLNDATRNYFGTYFKGLANNKFDYVLNGSADLSSTVKNSLGLKTFFNDDPSSREIKYGVREFAMSAIQNGILLHGGLLSVCSTFLVFADYMKPAIRLGSLMNLHNIHIFSHDSYCVGGDGPTHQPLDQLPMLRAIPNYQVHRPCDEIELAASLKIAFTNKKFGHSIVTTRQNLNSFPSRPFEEIKKGGYILKQGNDFAIVASGSEVTLAHQLAKYLEENQIYKSVKVVSVPNLGEFVNQPTKYVIEVLSNASKTILTLEASTEKGWYELSKFDFKVIHWGAIGYGASMDGLDLYARKGFNIPHLVELIKK